MSFHLEYLQCDRWDSRLTRSLKAFVYTKKLGQKLAHKQTESEYYNIDSISVRLNETLNRSTLQHYNVRHKNYMPTL